MGIFEFNKDIIDRLLESNDRHSSKIAELEERILRLEHPPKFKNLQEIYVCSYPCGGKPIKQKAIVIKSIYRYGSFESIYNCPPSYTYEISIEGSNTTVVTSDENFEPRNK